MATYARWTRTITDDAGNVRNAKVYVRKESDGLLATIYSDRAGATPKDNPFTLSNSDRGLAYFHAAGAAYEIEAIDGSWSQIWEYQALGTAAEYDVGSFIGSGQSPATVNTIAALKALSTSTYKIAVLNLGGQSGTFVFLSGDYATRVAADTLGGVYLKADDTASSSGAWVRVYADMVRPEWYGAVGDGATDDTAAVQAAVSSGENVFWAGLYKLTDTVTVPLVGNRVFRGRGKTVRAFVANMNKPYLKVDASASSVYWLHFADFCMDSLNTGTRTSESGINLSGSVATNWLMVKITNVGFLGLYHGVLVDKAGNAGGEGQVAKGEYIGLWSDVGSNGLVPGYVIRATTSINNGIVISDGVYAFSQAGIAIGNGSIHTGDIVISSLQFFGDSVTMGSACIRINGGSVYAYNVSIVNCQFEGSTYSLDFTNMNGSVIRGCNWGGGTTLNLVTCKNIQIDYSEEITPAQITSNQNDYNPSDATTGIKWVHAGTLRLSTDASRTLTGLKAFGDSRTVLLTNAGSNSLVLSDANASSIAANRFSFGRDITIPTGDSIVLFYDCITARWRSVFSRTTLGLGTSALVDTGASGTKVPLLNGANTWSALQIVTSGGLQAGAGSGGTYNGKLLLTPNDRYPSMGFYSASTGKSQIISDVTVGSFILDAPGGLTVRDTFNGGGVDWLQLTGTSAAFAKPVKVPSYTVATLPSAATVGAGSIAYVTDSNTTTYNATVAGGGANKIGVTSDGTNWKVS